MRTNFKRLVAINAMMLSVTWQSFAAEMELEWNSNYDVEVPYEVEISPAKLIKLGVAKNGEGLKVKADGKELSVVTVAGKAEGTVALRFNVPKGTKKLTCETCDTPLKEIDSTQVDNIFLGALADTSSWKSPSTIKKSITKEGLLFHCLTGEAEATFEAEVPKGMAGKPVKFEIGLGGRSQLTWANRVCVLQYDASGRELPENVVDPRWQTHMRPPNKDIVVKESGRLHPLAKKVKLCISLRCPGTSLDNYGMPLKEKSWNEAKLMVFRLAMRPTVTLPFPKYDDTRFAAGVSGNDEDYAIRLGGDRAFWYTTRSMAVWAGLTENTQQRDENNIFFPAGAGTCEAWFKPSSWTRDNVTTLFEGSHHNVNRWKGPQSGRGVLFAVRYHAKTSELEAYWKDMNDKVFSAKAKCELPIGAWSHIAAQWNPGGDGELYVNGNRILKVAMTDFAALDLQHEEKPNDYHVCECYLGSGYANSRDAVKPGLKYPMFDGAVDLWRVSTGVRYRGNFTPAKTLSVDEKTRAFFDFNRSFDGVSGGGIKFVRGSAFALTDKVDHVLKVGNKKVQYWAKELLPENNPEVVLNPLNYPVMPTVEDFHAARKVYRKVYDLKPGEKFQFDAPKVPFSDFVQIENTGAVTIKYPIVLNEGDIDTRSFGDIADTLCDRPMSDKDRVNKVFQFLLGASDYFMNHSCIIMPGEDKGYNVEYRALKMLNGYCGFECGPLNNMAANLFSCSAGCPAGQTGGYGHSFEQVFYNEKNHIYDLSAQKFFPALDNETAEYLEEAGDQPGSFQRVGSNPDHFIRMSTRACGWVQTPSYQTKVAMEIRPQEVFRVWFDNDGQVNDLSCSKQTTVGTMRKQDYTARVGAVPGQNPIYRINRFFPHYGNGFLEWKGKPTKGNPVFVKVEAGSFCYDVKSCYPIVYARYQARLKNGSLAKTKISGDYGKTWRDLPEGDLKYEVMSRQEYLVKIMAPITEVAEFSAMTEVMVNVRIFPGRVKGGKNNYVFKAETGETARVTIQCRANAKPIVVKEGVYAGTIPGAEQQVVLLNPKSERTLEVEGTSASAKAVGLGGIKAKLAAGKLIISAGSVKRGFAGVRIEDEGAAKLLTVIVCDNARLITADKFKPFGAVKVEPNNEERVQACAMFRQGEGGGVEVPFEELPAGKYSLMTLDRYPSHPSSFLAPWMACSVKGTKGLLGCGYPGNHSCNFYKAQYGQKGERANFKWDYACDPTTKYYCSMMNVFDMPVTSSVKINNWSKSKDAAELAAVLIVPTEDEEFYCDLIKVLCGLNTQLWRVK